MKELIAGNLTRYRKSLRLSQEELAATVGVTRQSINNYENAKTLPDSKTLSALARAFGVTLDDLLRQESTALLNFRFRTHTSDKKPQFAAQVLRLLEDYTAPLGSRDAPLCPRKHPLLPTRRQSTTPTY